MKLYEVKGMQENGENIVVRSIEANETDARKAFKEICKSEKIKATIESIEIISENQPASKKNEREALAKIEKIIEELGENSYIAAAFEGCLEDAKTNIENDFSISMKQRYEIKRDELEEQKTINEELKSEIEELKTKLEKSACEIENLEGKIIDPQDVKKIIGMIDAELEKSLQIIEKASVVIVQNARYPECIDFIGAVEELEEATNKKDIFTKMKERIMEKIK